MSRHPWMPFYSRDFQHKTFDLDADEQGVYIQLICLAWEGGGGSVPADEAVLKRMLQARIANFHGLTFNRIVPKILARFFVRSEGIWYQPRVVSELRMVRERSEKQSRNARERWSKVNIINDLPHATAYAKPMPPHSHSYTPTNSDSETEPLQPQGAGEKKEKIQASEHLKSSLRRKGWPG